VADLSRARVREPRGVPPPARAVDGMPVRSRRHVERQAWRIWTTFALVFLGFLGVAAAVLAVFVLIVLVVEF
jgi:hypothetical protein